MARYEVPIGSGRLALQVDGRWQDDVFFTAENNPALVQDSFGVVNFRGSYTFPGERFMASVFVRNAFDRNTCWVRTTPRTPSRRTSFSRPIPGLTASRSAARGEQREVVPMCATRSELIALFDKLR